MSSMQSSRNPHPTPLWSDLQAYTDTKKQVRQFCYWLGKGNEAVCLGGSKGDATLHHSGLSKHSGSRRLACWSSPWSIDRRLLLFRTDLHGRKAPQDNRVRENRSTG
ncbi:hypothetical protein ACJ73_10370 [Blastomyces percursus]|uniref:Uncharacterized protein n=1 Tax=Blastomyces percursus TaxID=1658174 RepID=A0A1J9Q0A6_9EURO|nr:hypothetical protein ACJ73_10370 [Blastomyces percursus]